MFTDNLLYKKDIETAASAIDWQGLKNAKIAVTGASGLIGTVLIDILMHRNIVFNDNIVIYAFGRSREKITARFGAYLNSPFFIFVEQDLQNPIALNAGVDYIIHGASNTHPVAYATNPINTLLLSVIGTKHILDFAAVHGVKRTVFLSSVEIYGENQGDIERFTEDYSGYIDCNTLRACYTEGKRASESLCQAYIHEKSMDIVIARCCRVYGPTMQDDDTKVIAQFLRCAKDNKNIVLKSKGEQQFSYCYVADVSSALFVILLKGRNGEAYNVSGANSITLLQIAKILADYIHKDIAFEIPSSIETSGYSKAVKALLDSSKLGNLGWTAKDTIEKGLIKTVEILKGL
jgi:nucleoside-diphosphate-sugar epimerase